MLLESIDQPSDLRDLTADQLETLATEIRDHIVRAVSANGGHLGSNLGVVELTLAVHRVFESPQDVILWDTGHLAYVHKILTGRRDDFAHLRQAGGLSGYPCRAESEHDWIENSHASTVLSYAFGVAEAFRVQGIDRRVVSIIGDGSLTGGMAFEGLNNLGHSDTRAIIILNDNGRSYAPTVSKLSDSLGRLRLHPSYLRNRARLDRILHEVPLVGEHLERGVEGALAALREMFEPPAFFEMLGVRYTGPFDGHDIAGLESALRNAGEYDGPIVVHVLTQKGRGYAPAETDPIKRLHDMSPDSKPGSYTAAFTEAVIKEAEHRPELVAITAAMPDSTGLLPFKERFPDRFFDVGIAEQHAVTAASGMAMGGLRPVVAIYSTFLSRAFDQVNLDVGMHGQPVVFCLDRAGITGDDGASHHGVLDMVLLSKVPGMTIFAPSSYHELGVMLHDALELCTDGPAMIRFPKTMPPEELTGDEVGSGLMARKVRAGRDVCFLAVGKMLAAAREAAEALAAEGVEATVWDVRVAKPLDEEMLAEAAGYPAVVTIEDGYRAGGIGASIAGRLGALAPSGVAPRVAVLGVPDRFIQHGKPDAILASLGLDGAGVARAARDLLA
jgi:1-deoxy-D-xylulose-5-phosphate synthase